MLNKQLELEKEKEHKLTIEQIMEIKDRIKDINENRFITYGKYMYILNHKGDVPEDILVKLLPSMEKTIEDEYYCPNSIIVKNILDLLLNKYICLKHCRSS